MEDNFFLWGVTLTERISDSWEMKITRMEDKLFEKDNEIRGAKHSLLQVIMQNFFK